MPESPNPKLREAPSPTFSAAKSPYAYAELDMKTNFSFLRGASHPDELVYRAAQLGYRAIAVTDFNSLAGVVRAYEAAREIGIKLLSGSRLTFEDAPDVLVWAPDRAAYATLCRLLTLGKRRTEKGKCLLRLEDLLNENSGLLAAVVASPSGGESNCSLKNEKYKLKTEDAANRASSPQFSFSNFHFSISNLSFLKDSFGSRISLASSCSYGSDDATHLRRIAEIGRHFGIPLLATNDVYYHDPSRHMLQDVLTCVRHGCTIQEAGFRLFPNGERYLKPPEKMHRLFEDYPEAIHRGLEIADACNFKLDSLKYEYPDELTPPGKTAIEYLSELTWNGAAQRYPQGIPDRVRKLIEHELSLIRQLSFEHYFLTVYDLVRFARSRGILCQGRGSAANSAVCYCIDVTSVDPSQIDVLFERFISAARGEPPDIDIDFEHERREEVIQYIYEKYGRERAGMTAEVITYRGRSAIRDVGKVMGLSLDMVDSLAGKLDWWHRGLISADQIREAGLDPGDRTIGRVIDIAGQLLGFPRHLSQHVGGMVMTRGPLCEMVPIENASMENRTVIEWDKDDIDAVGILKVDALALGMLTCISKAFKLLNRRNEREARSQKPEARRNSAFSIQHSAFSSALSTQHSALPSCPLELHTIPPNDPAIYDMIGNADTIGVFQIESRAQMSMLPRLRPRSFYDLVIEVAIVRPGPIQGNMVHPYLRRRSGEEPVSYPSEALRKVLAKTLGVPLFQEQAMKIAMVGAGFSADEADKLRRAMASWRRSGAIESFHRKIIDGMVGNGYTPEFAEQCFQQIKGFGEYGFPESHAASFALLVYVSAWLKCHHPAAFACALLNSQPMGFYAPAQIVRDAKEHGVEVRPVDVNASEWDCTLEEGRHGGTKARRHEGEGRDKGSICLAAPLGGRWAQRDKGPARQRDEGEEARRVRFSGRSYSAFSIQHSAFRSVLSPQSSVLSSSLRLGFRQLKGFRQEHANAIVAARARCGLFASIEQFHRQTGLPVSALKVLAEADAFGSMHLSRRQALWQVLRLKDESHPLFDAPSSPNPICDFKFEIGSFQFSIFSFQSPLAPSDPSSFCAPRPASGTAKQSDPSSLCPSVPLSLPPPSCLPPVPSCLPLEPSVSLPPMPLGQEVMIDYATAGLSLKRHPVALIRADLAQRRIISAAQLMNKHQGNWVKVAGLVLVRQRPGTASGIVFATLEDEAGIVNLIIHSTIYDRYRLAARHAHLLQADGYVQRQGQIVHVLAKRLFDLSDLLAGLDSKSRDFH